jgi:mRNA interferase HigB
VEIINVSELHHFTFKHAKARRAFSNWLDVTLAADWNSFADVRETFRSADYVKNVVVFDVGGNNYRLICSIDYWSKRVSILEVLTHSEYDRWKA